MNFSKLLPFQSDIEFFTEIEDYVKDAISKNAKNQISFNNFIQAEHKKSQMTEWEE